MRCLYDDKWWAELTPIQELFCTLGVAILAVGAVVGLGIVKISEFILDMGRKEFWI